MPIVKVKGGYRVRSYSTGRLLKKKYKTKAAAKTRSSTSRRRSKRKRHTMRKRY
tara:strand:+ start:3242 stop:3403 length:162 start_codon:yes stop_codon:yes gene_type:complete